jgi:hypothetical protein
LAPARETGRKGRVQRVTTTPTTKVFEGLQTPERTGMLEDMHEVPERELFNIINALSAFRRVMTIDEVAILLAKSKWTIYRMAQKKRIPAFRNLLKFAAL